MEKEKKRKIFNICNLICIGLMVLVVVFQMLPSWSVNVSKKDLKIKVAEGEPTTVKMDTSLWNYVAFPSEGLGKSFTRILESSISPEYNIKHIILAPYGNLICLILAVVFLLKQSQGFIPIVSALCGSIGTVAYLGHPFYATGGLWFMPLILFLLMILVAIYAMFTYYSKKKAIGLSAAIFAVLLYLAYSQVPSYAANKTSSILLVVITVCVLGVVGGLFATVKKGKKA